MIEKYFETGCKFVYQHFESSVEPQDVVSTEDAISKTRTNINVENSDINHLDNHKRLLYEKVMAKKTIKKQVWIRITHVVRY